MGELAAWLGLDVGYLRWMADLGDRNRKAGTAKLQHYHVQLLPKSDGGVRLLEIAKQHIKHVQRQILHELLNHVPLHRSVHGFRKGRSILSYAEPHARKACVLRLDLQDFFASISGPRVQTLFRTLGYPEHVADLLGGLCTTTTPDLAWKDALGSSDLAGVQSLRLLCRRAHLPQGAPTSPAIANLCAFRLDQRLAALAKSVGAEYTRYADDLTFSGDENFARLASRLLIRVAAIVAEEGFQVRWRKTRLMRSSVRQHLGGLIVNGGPNVARRDWDQLKATLTNCVRHGPASQNREDHPDFRAHLQGRIAFVAMVKPDRAVKLRALFAQIRWD